MRKSKVVYQKTLKVVHKKDENDPHALCIINKPNPNGITVDRESIGWIDVQPSAKVGDTAEIDDNQVMVPKDTNQNKNLQSDHHPWCEMQTYEGER